MPIEKKKLATILGYLGLIPFFALTIIFFISNFNNYVVDVYLFYANIILSFLCGSQWSKILNSNISNNRNLLLKKKKKKKKVKNRGKKKKKKKLFSR